MPETTDKQGDFCVFAFNPRTHELLFIDEGLSLEEAEKQVAGFCERGLPAHFATVRRLKDFQKEA